MADVVVEVELGVVDPHWPSLPERDEAELLPKARDQMQPRRDVVTNSLYSGVGPSKMVVEATCM